MSTARRRRGHSLHLDLPSGQSEDLPSISAIFLITFDVKAGYTIAWKRSTTGLELSESVEYKSLPSGLHNVSEDLIYFIHDEQFAGISAFVNEQVEEADRNAVMLAVGALMPLSHGRMGKSWKHAEGLKELAERMSHDSTNTKPLEEFWDANRLHEQGAQEQTENPDSPSTEKAKRRQSQLTPDAHQTTRKRAVSTASQLANPGQSLSLHHPALSLPVFLDTFGPLVFALYKASLLRRRILMVGHAPVELACNFVYDISLLSGIPSSVIDLLPLEPLPTRQHTLFSVGIHDIDTLSQGARTSATTDEGFGWIACTTDDILSHKPQLYDTLVTIPPAHTEQAKDKVWPRVEAKKGTEIKATQRDLRRYRTMRRELRRFSSNRSPPTAKRTNSDSAIDLPQESTQETYDEASETLDADLAEPQSWAELAYSSFMWWASAGERRTDLDEEEEYDAALLHRFDHYSESSPSRPRSARKSPGRSPGMNSWESQPAGLEMSIVAYFHRFTTLILKTISDIVDEADGESVGDQAGGDPERERLKPNGEGDPTAYPIVITHEDMTRMGLDVWSESDRDFVRELVAFYWGREAHVKGGRVECCGVRIC